MSTNSGIYIITHVDTGRTYIGASSNLQRRKYQHYRELHTKKHSCAALQSDFIASGVGNSAIEFRVIETCEIDDLSRREKENIAAMKPSYNKTTGGVAVRSVSDETREKMRQNWTGKQMRKTGTYIVPWGIFDSSYAAASASNGEISQFGVFRSCMQSTRVINRKAWTKSLYLQAHHDESVVGKTWSEIGFSFIADEQK